MNRTVLCFLLSVFCLVFCNATFAAEDLVELDAKLEIISGQVKLTRVGSNKTDVIDESCQLYAYVSLILSHYEFLLLLLLIPLFVPRFLQGIEKLALLHILKYFSIQASFNQ